MFYIDFTLYWIYTSKTYFFHITNLFIKPQFSMYLKNLIGKVKLQTILQAPKAYKK